MFHNHLESNPGLEGFWKAFEDTLRLVEKAHLERFEIMKAQSPKAAPFMYQNGTIKQKYHGQEYLQQYEDATHHINSDGKGTPIDLVAVRQDGSMISPRVMLHTSEIIHKDLDFPEFDFHSLRHTHTSMLLAAGAPIKYVQCRLGHKRPDVTLRVYQHMTEVIEKNGVEVLGEVYTKCDA